MMIVLTILSSGPCWGRFELHFIVFTHRVHPICSLSCDVLNCVFFILKLVVRTIVDRKSPNHFFCSPIHYFNRK